MKRVFRALIDVISWCFAALGPRRAVALGRALGLFAFYVIPIRRKVVLENLARALPEKSDVERWRIARSCYRQIGRVIAETLFLPRLGPEALAKLTRWHDAEIVDNAFAQQKGVIFCMSHMGNWELIGFEAGRRGYPIYAITKVLKGAFNEAIIESRKKNFKELPPSGSFERGIQALSENASVALIIDQHRAGNRAVLINFFGRPAATSPGAALFHLRTGAPVIAGWMTVGPDDVYDLWFRGPFPWPEAPTEAEQIRLHTQMLADDLEKFVREHDNDWFWVHRRWKADEEAAAAAAVAQGDHA
jgi:KDO2-lipid IV(A) lauroyltransferase